MYVLDYYICYVSYIFKLVSCLLLNIKIQLLLLNLENLEIFLIFNGIFYSNYILFMRSRCFLPSLLTRHEHFIHNLLPDKSDCHKVNERCDSIKLFEFAKFVNFSVKILFKVQVLSEKHVKIVSIQ